MKYKAKISCKFSGWEIEEGQVFDSTQKGILLYVPFTDTRFFEPVKTRTFQVEVSEDQMHIFNAYIVQPDDLWTVTEITEPSWITQYYKSGSFNAHLFSTDELCKINVEEFKDEYQYGRKLQGVKWLKDQFGKGLKESKDLADFIFAL